MHSDLHTDLDNLDSVENNLRHSAKGSNDGYDVTFSLTSLTAWRNRFCSMETMQNIQDKAYRCLTLEST